MCGVYLRISKQDNFWLSYFDSKNLKQLEKRGPDNTYSEAVESQILYGFTRLAIRSIEDGSQPFNDGRFVSAFNGEIYNSFFLSERIRSKFPDEIIPENDTKLLGLWLYLFGPMSIKEVDGMFAGYIHIGSKIYAFTDRVGEKPLYYGFYRDVFFISSNLPKFIDAKVMLSDQFLISGLLNFRINEEVSILSPGTFLEIEDIQIIRELKVHSYWEWPKRKFMFNKSKSKNFESALIFSIKSQLASDVGMSVLLSGGIDSGIVAAIARKEFGPKLESFTLAFKDSIYSEKYAANQTARYLSLKNRVVEVSYEELAQNVNSTIEAMDIPILDTGALSLFTLCKEVSKNQKVALTGDGGDELFRGYSVFDHVYILNLLKSLPLKFPVSLVLNALRNSSFLNDRYIGPELMLSRAMSITSNRDFNPLFATIGPFGGTDLYNLICARSEFKSYAPKNKFYSKLDIENYFINEVLPKIYLVKSDRMSMCHGLELRSPLLNHRVIESAFGFSESSFWFKEKKRVLRKIARKYLPQEVIDSKKHGFSAPFHKVVRYLETPNWKSPRSEKELMLYNKIWADAKKGVESAGIPAWNLLVIENFFNRNIEQVN